MKEAKDLVRRLRIQKFERRKQLRAKTLERAQNFRKEEAKRKLKMKEREVEDKKSESKNRKITRQPGHVSKIFESVSPASQAPRKIERSKQADIEAKAKAKAEVEHLSV